MNRIRLFSWMLIAALAVAAPATAQTKNKAPKSNVPVTMLAKPVRAPSATPAADSM